MQSGGLAAALLRMLTITTRAQQDVAMRTTLTLDPDVAQLVRETIEHEHVTLKDAINEGFRRGLKPIQPRRSLRIAPHHCLLQPGLDPRGFNQLADEFENEAVLAAWKKSR